MNVLVLKSSILADNSQSNKLADYTIEKLKGHNIVVREDVYKRQALITAWKATRYTRERAP